MSALDKNRNKFLPLGRSSRVVLYATMLLGVAFALRLILFQGFVLGDDPLFLYIVRLFLNHTLPYNDQLECRIFTWGFSALSAKLFGLSETSYFLPIWLFSSSMSLLAFGMLLQHRYRLHEAFLGGLFVATAPFEVLLGTTNAIDMYLEWFLGAALLVMWVRTTHKIAQGALLAVLLWAAFYVKLWAVFFLPMIVLFYVLRAWRTRQLKGCVSFSVSSVALHAATCAVCNFKSGVYRGFFQGPTR